MIAEWDYLYREDGSDEEEGEQGLWFLMTSNACQYTGVPVAVSTGRGSVCLVS